MSSLFATTPASQETASLFINEKIASARTKVNKNVDISTFEWGERTSFNLNKIH